MLSRTARAECTASLLSEAGIMCKINHENIVHLYGVVLSNPPMLVSVSNVRFQTFIFNRSLNSPPVDHCSSAFEIALFEARSM